MRRREKVQQLFPQVLVEPVESAAPPGEARRGYWKLWFGLACLVVLVVAGSASAAFLAGRASRPSQAELRQRGPQNTAWTSNSFVSPSGNIRCRYFPSTSTIGCMTRNNGREVIMPAYGRPWADTVSHYFPPGPVLYYGEIYTVEGEFRCVSRTDGMFCRSVPTDRGFIIHRGGYRLF